ncbi:hypothetical protein ACHAPU_007264, partial [Fusarium lateritium]
MGTPQEIYNNLGDVYEASKMVASRPHVLLALAKLLVEHGLDKMYDIRLNHKHFDITDNEQVVSFTGRDLTLSAVCTNGKLPLSLLSAEGIILVPGGTIRPSDVL